MANYSYSALEVVVTAATRPMETAIAESATKAGTKAGESVSGHMSRGLAKIGPAARAVGKSAAVGLGLATTAAVAFGVKAYKAAEESNKITAQTAQVIKSTGGAANVTVASINRLTSSMMAKTGIDDETIKSGENMLLTFRNVRNEAGKNNDVFNQASSTLLDMTAALTGGNVTAAATRKQAIQLGKALNDPIKGISALSRVGVQFTDQQKAQITTLVKSGHTLEAQKIILRELNTEFGGSAAASATATERLKTSYQELQESVGRLVIRAVDPALESLGKLASRFTAATAPGGKLAPIINAIGDAATSVLAPLSGLTDMMSGWLDHLKPAQINAAADAIRRFGPALAAAGAAAAVFTGAGLAESIPGLGPLFSTLLAPLNAVKGAMISVGRAALVQMVPALEGAAGEVTGLGAALGGMAAPVAIAVGAFGLLMATSPPFRKAVMDIARALLAALAPALVEIAASTKTLIPPITQVAMILGGALAVALEAVVPLIRALGVVLAFIAPVLPQLVGAFIAYKVAVKAAAAAQWLLNIALDANPIGVVILALAALTAAFVVAWNHSATFRKIVIGAWRDILGAAKAVWNWIKSNWPLLVGMLGGPLGVAAALVLKHWTQIRNYTTTAWRAIQHFVASTMSTIRSNITGTLNSVRSTVSRIFGQIRSIVSGAISAVRSTITGGMSSARRTVTSGVTNILGQMSRLASGFLAGGRSAIRNLLSGMVAALRGIDGWVKSHVVDPVVNAVKHWFGIHSPSAVMAGVGQNVTAGFIQGIVHVNPLAVARTVFGGIPAALGSMVSKGLVAVASLPGRALHAITGLGGQIGGLLSKVPGIFGFGGSGPSGGGGVAQWSGLMHAVLAHFGIPGLFSTFMSQMQTESGGNPRAINLWDTNARAGIPSQGLMQVVPPTFAAYAGPYRSRGIYDPLANIYAAVAYAVARYGKNIGSVLGHGHGYAKGGILNELITGFGHRTGQIYHFGEKGPELVSPLSRRGSLGSLDISGGRLSVVINVYPQKGQSETEIAAAVSRRLSWAVATGKA